MKGAMYRRLLLLMIFLSLCGANEEVTAEQDALEQDLVDVAVYIKKNDTDESLFMEGEAHLGLRGDGSKEVVANGRFNVSEDSISSVFYRDGRMSFMAFSDPGGDFRFIADQMECGSLTISMVTPARIARGVQVINNAWYFYVNVLYEGEPCRVGLTVLYEADIHDAEVDGELYIHRDDGLIIKNATILKVDDDGILSQRWLPREEASDILISNPAVIPSLMKIGDGIKTAKTFSRLGRSQLPGGINHGGLRYIYKVIDSGGHEE